MTSLLRSAVGTFEVSEARTLAEIEEAVKVRPDDIGGLLIPVERMLEGLPGLQVTSLQADKLLRNGNILQTGQVRQIGDGEGACFTPADGREYRIYDFEGVFTAVYTWTAEKNCLKNKKMFI